MTALATTDHETGQQRIARCVDREPVEDRGEEPQRERGDHRDDERAPQHLTPRRPVVDSPDELRCALVAQRGHRWSGHGHHDNSLELGDAGRVRVVTVR